MSMTPNIAAMRIIRDLHTSEHELDQAMASSATLLSTMMQSRIETESPIAMGQVAVMRLVRALSALGEARGELVRTHGELLKVGQVHGVLMDGDCPPAGGQLDAEAVALKAA
jgi:hypothetical protein